MVVEQRSERLRRDAQRNREILVTTARQAFSTEGLDISMDAIARAAGVGAGTLYRHFSSKDDLIAAVIDLDEPRLEAERNRIAAAGLEPVQALEEWLDVLARRMTVYDGLPGPLRAAVDATGTPPPLGGTCDIIVGTTEAFLAPVRSAGLAKPDLTGRALFLACLGMAWAGASIGDDVDTRQQLSAVLRSGWSAQPPSS